MTFPLLTADPHAGFMPVRGELIAAFERVLDGGRYILGEEVAAFEREWAERCETEHAVGLSSGTDALALALRAVGVGPNDEVLVPAMTAVASWMAVRQIGAVPVGVDIEPLRNGMDPDLARAAISPRTRAIVAVHLFGQPADVDALLDLADEAKIPLVEDAAQAHGARLGAKAVGSLGSIAAFSFYPTKNLGAIGDAGAVSTGDPMLADRVRALREYGWRTRSDAQFDGVNARLDELQAALLRVMLKGLQARTRRRASIAAAYLRGLTDIPQLQLPSTVAASEPVWHQFVVLHPRRGALAQGLASAGIGSAVHYQPPPPLNSAFDPDGQAAGKFPVAERHARSALSLPMHPALSDSQTEFVIDTVRTLAAKI
jgi:dTDP-4-amino-4,6-dideoxygalactose transaminase